MALRSLLAFAALVALASGHGAVTIPPPRQAIDADVAPWSGSVPAYPIPFDSPNWCAIPDAKSTDPRKLSGSNGLARLVKV